MRDNCKTTTCPKYTFLLVGVISASMATADAQHEWSEWRAENSKLCRLVPGRGKDGGTAMGVYAQADGKGAGYWSRPFIYKPNTCYGAEFWVDRYRTGSEVIVENGYQWVIHGSDLNTGWTEMKTVFKTPVGDQMLTNAYKLCDYHPQGETFFDQPRMVELTPQWRKADGLELGDGEFVSGNLYSFVTHLKAPACAVTRPYVGVSKGARSGFKFDIPSGGEILYRFTLPERRFRDGDPAIRQRIAQAYPPCRTYEHKQRNYDGENGQSGLMGPVTIQFAE